MQPYSTQRMDPSYLKHDRCQCVPSKDGRPHTMKGLGEGRIPGVVIAPANMTGRQYDWRRPADDDEFAMSDNSSFALGGMSLGKIGMLGGMNAFISKAEESTIWGMVDGTLYGDLLSAQRRQQNMNAEVAKLGLAADQMSEGAAKAEARGKYRLANEENQKASQSLAGAVKSYNEVATAMRKIPFAGLQPKMLSGLGSMGAIPAIAIYSGLAVLGAVAALQALAALVESFRAESGRARGYLDQLAEVIKQGGGVIHETMNLGLVAALLGGGFLAYRILQAKGHAR